MSETTSGLMRMVVLLTATALFAAVWNGDRQTQEQFIVARKAASEQAHQTLLSDRATSAEQNLHRRNFAQEPVKQTIGDGLQSIAGTSYVARVEIEMTLPGGIDSGRYQVVDQSGQVQTIRVTTACTEAKTQDIYVLNQPDGSRRFFIRISDNADGPSLSRTASESASQRQ